MPKLNLGCGNVALADAINIDIRPGAADIVRDVLRGLPYADNTIDEIYSENFLEHIPQTEVIWLMNEMHRVMLPGGLMVHRVPIAGTEADYQDPTHLSRWHWATFTYFEYNHPRNLYYGEAIKPWILESREAVPPNNTLIEVRMRKP